MRRMFQGRMISIDGCMKRMQPNWNCYFIDKDNDRGSLLINQGRTMSSVGEPLIWAENSKRLSLIYPVKAGHKYRWYATKPGYDTYFGSYYNQDLKIVQPISGGQTWASKIEHTAEIDGYVYISLAKTNHDLDITVGECGIVFEEIR